MSLEIVFEVVVPFVILIALFVILAIFKGGKKR